MNLNDMLPYIIGLLGAFVVCFQIVTIRFGVTRVEEKLDRLIEALKADRLPPPGE